MQLFGRRDDRTAGPCDPIGVRSALRAFAGLSDIGIDTYWRHNREKGQTTLLMATRAIFVAWASLAYEGVSEAAIAAARTRLAGEIAAFDEAKRHFHEDHVGMNAYHIGSMVQGVEASRRVLALAAWAIGWPLERPPGEANRPFFDPLETLAPLGLTQTVWVEHQRSAQATDRALLAQGIDVRELMFRRLWRDAAGEAYEAHAAGRSWLQLAKRQMLGDRIVTWLLERRPGALVLGVRPEEAAERVVRIANLPSEFWEDRHPEDVRYGFDYALHADMGNAAWGAIERSLYRLTAPEDRTGKA